MTSALALQIKRFREILKYFDLSEHYADVKEWYDGYHFGNANVYCPWDVINYMDLLRLEPTAKPQDFWSNSSENALVRNFIDKANVQTKYEIECLIAGEYIEKEISLELTYDEIDQKHCKPVECALHHRLPDQAGRD